jgi:hypothetical protein
MKDLALLMEVALNASVGNVGSILAGLLKRACPMVAAAKSAVHERARGGIGLVKEVDGSRATTIMIVPQQSTEARTYICRTQRCELYIKRRVAASRWGEGGYVTGISTSPTRHG